MSRTVAGTLLLPDGQPMANASIYFTAKRTEAVSIIEGSNTFFNTNAFGVYSQSVVNGFYAVSIEYIADASGAYSRRWQLGDVFIETGAPTTLEALIIASNVPDDIALGVFYAILADAQQAAADAQAAANAAQDSAQAAADAAASVVIGTGPSEIPNNTILNTRLGTAGNLGTAAQKNVGTAGADVSDNSQLNTRLGTSGNLGTSAQQNANNVAFSGGNINATTIGATTRAAGNFTTIDANGNVTITGAARKLLGDFSNATLSNRVFVETSTTNSSTSFGIKPSGTNQSSHFAALNSSDPANSSRVRLSADPSSVSIVCDSVGAGVSLPFEIYTGGSLSNTVGTDGSFTLHKTGVKIKGDFSNATVSSRIHLQTTTVNGATRVSAIPNGTGTTCDFEAYNNSNPDNASGVRITATSSDVRLESIMTGSGGYLPLNIYNSGVTKVTIPTSGNSFEVVGKASASGGFLFPPFTVATVPSAAANANTGIKVTNSSLGNIPYWSDGTNWRSAANVILS